MTDYRDSLFLIRLPFGEKTIPYTEVPERIAKAKSPWYDKDTASGVEAACFAADFIIEENKFEEAVRNGDVEVLDKSFHRVHPPFLVRLEYTVLTIRAFREYVESIHGAVLVDATPELPTPAPVAPSASNAPVVAETVAQRRARWLDMLEAEEKREKRGALTRLAKSEGVDRANMSKDIGKARAARDTENRAGAWTSQLVQDGKRQR